MLRCSSVSTNIVFSFCLFVCLFVCFYVNAIHSYNTDDRGPMRIECCKESIDHYIREEMIPYLVSGVYHVGNEA